ncbi:MAG: hypothetical protein ACE14W_01610 [Candidatus Velamenicoccus archaeovorus]
MGAAGPAAGASVNGYHVDVQEDPDGWRVTIRDRAGRAVSERACRDEREAWTYASTVRQHAYWLSEESFRRYYRIAEPDEEDGRDTSAGTGDAVAREG